MKATVKVKYDLHTVASWGGKSESKKVEMVILHQYVILVGLII